MASDMDIRENILVFLKQSLGDAYHTASRPQKAAFCLDVARVAKQMADEYEPTASPAYGPAPKSAAAAKAGGDKAAKKVGPENKAAAGDKPNKKAGPGGKDAPADDREPKASPSPAKKPGPGNKGAADKAAKKPAPGGKAAGEKAAKKPGPGNKAAGDKAPKKPAAPNKSAAQSHEGDSVIDNDSDATVPFLEQFLKELAQIAATSGDDEPIAAPGPAKKPGPGKKRAGPKPAGAQPGRGKAAAAPTTVSTTVVTTTTTITQ